MWGTGHGHRPDPPPTQPGEQHLVTDLDGGLEPQDARVLCPRAGRPDQRRPRTQRLPGRRVDRQPAANPPPQILAAIDRAKPDAADDGAGPVAGDEHDRTRVLVALIPIVAGEEALPVHKHLGTDGPVGGHRRGVAGRLDVERGRALAQQGRDV
jgi:hypothetical protein